LSRAEDAEKGLLPDTSAGLDTAKCGKLALALARATGCNSLKQHASEKTAEEADD
jgi:hypothetical protein